MYHMLEQKCRAPKAALMRFAQQLVQTPSPTFDEGRVADLVERQMRDLGYDKVVRDEAGNVIGVMYGYREEPTVLLASHMDTADTAMGEVWDESPYTGRLADGRLYGAGASDCKAGLAAQIFAGAVVRRSLLPMEGNLVVAATVAEEAGGSVGVRGLMDRTLPEMELSPAYAVLGEPTNLGLYYGHDGWVEIEVCVEGANPFHVDDAAQAIYAEFDSQHRTSKFGGQRQMMSLDVPRFEDVGRTRRATMVVNRRLGSSEEMDSLLGQLKRSAAMAAQSSGAVAVDVMVRQGTERLYTGTTTLVQHVVNAWSTDPFDPLMERARQSLAAAGCDATPGKWQLGRLGMGTAGSALVNDYGVPTIGYGPGDETVAHAANESVDAANVQQALYGTVALVHSLVGVPVFGWTTADV